MRLIEKKFPGNIKLKFKVETTTDEKRVLEMWAIRDYFKKRLVIQNKDIVIDIGAHIGTFTVYAAKLAKEGMVYSFEPHPENIRLLKENCELNNLKNVKLFRYGVCGKRRKVKLFIDENYTGRHSLYKKSQKFIFIECITLKEIFDANEIGHCNFLKLDCEGAEYDILFNTPQDYFDKIDKIVLEYHDYLHQERIWPQLARFLHQRGFKIIIDPYSENQGLIYAKNIWRKKSIGYHLNLVTNLITAKSKIFIPSIFIKIEKGFSFLGLFLKKYFSGLYSVLKKLK
jgi:FkbM family methyltransferase